MSILLFNADTFSSLSTIEYASQWEQIAFDQLWEDEQTVINEFLLLAKGDTDIKLNLKDVLLVKTSDDRMLERVYGPSIFRESAEGDGLILKAGSNVFPIVIQNERLTIGHLIGKFQWLTRKRLDETTYDVLVARLYDSRSEDDDPLMYEIGCSLAATSPTTEVNGQVQKNPLYLSQPKLDKLLAANAGLGQFFSAPKSGGGSVYKMQQLGANTEWEVIGVDVTEPHPEYGVSYILRLAGGASCFARGNSETLLKRNFNNIKKQLESGMSWTLKVGKVEEFAPGKTSVNNALVQRTPAIAGTAPKQIQQAPKAIASAPAQPKKPASRDELVKWATSKGIDTETINNLLEDINKMAQQKASEGQPMSSEDKRDSFMASIEAGLKAYPIMPAIEVQAEPVADVDGIPF